jgi:hypothetical protein
MSRKLKQIHLAAHFPGVNNTTVWSDPRSGSHIEFGSFAHLARTAERAKFDFEWSGARVAWGRAGTRRISDRANWPTGAGRSEGTGSDAAWAAVPPPRAASGPGRQRDAAYARGGA